MPEGPEIRIMSDFINFKSDGRVYKDLYLVEKGNIPHRFDLVGNFGISSNYNGKELNLRLHGEKDIDFSVFMGMSGNWKFVSTVDWDLTKFIRMRIDSQDGNSLVLYGGYMGPKYKIGGFSGVKRGPDIVKDFGNFKINVLSNLDKKAFDGPMCDVLLDQRYFNGVGNYIRSTILYYMGLNPFEVSRDYIENNPQIFDMCRDVQIVSYELNGGQLKDWKNPFDTDREKFKEWVFYQKGISCKDKTNRTFWFDSKWLSDCPYELHIS